MARWESKNDDLVGRAGRRGKRRKVQLNVENSVFATFLEQDAITMQFSRLREFMF